MPKVFAPVSGSISAGNIQPPTSSSSTLATAAAVGTNSTSAVVPSTSMQHADVGGIPPALICKQNLNIKTEPVVAGQQQNGGGCGKRFKTLSKVQCAECDEFLPNSDASRLHHTNVKHLKLCLYMCPVCNKEFMSAFNGPRISIQHIKTPKRGRMCGYGSGGYGSGGFGSGGYGSGGYGSGGGGDCNIL
uniref:C2H2-type domain-containing protein n=1 Tax=Globodera rostochiensis TaxID=31243 RepID=A0A914HFC1_GLORO